MLCKRPIGGVVPCGDCAYCMANECRVWTHRIMLESRYHAASSFVTLTIDPKNKKDGVDDLNVDKKICQDFIKRFRETYSKDLPFKYVLSAEYGYSPPRYHGHYHMALMGWPPCLRPDIAAEQGRKGLSCWCPTCDPIAKAWGHGKITNDRLEPASAMYVAGYVVEKLKAKTRDELSGRAKVFRLCSKGVGFVAIPDILKAMDGLLMPDTDDVPFALTVPGGKIMPLGKSMINKMRKELFGAQEKKTVFGMRKTEVAKELNRKKMEIKQMIQNEDIEKLKKLPRFKNVPDHEVEHRVRQMIAQRKKQKQLNF